MNRRVIRLFIFGLALLSLPAVSFGQQSLSEIGFSGQFFFSYEHDVYEDGYTNEFTIKRGYITFRKDLSDRFEIRFTQDITIDEQGDGLGDIELRLKYALVKYSMDDIGLFTSPNIEAGVVHRPWTNFEQDVNDYRSQKSMFLDQNDILSSADYGLQFAAALGPELDEDKQRGLESNPGRYGSFAIGLYNGGGYSDLEFNNNKLVEASLSLRPFPDQLPGIQASLLGAYGKGNIPESPDFNLIGSALTYESIRANLVLQGFRGTGDGSGRFINPRTFEAYDLEGWSTFAELQPFEFPVKITLRYDELYNRDLNRLSVQQWVAGVAYVFSNRSKILLDVSRRNVNSTFNTEEFTRFEVVTEVRF
ncbi:hypothetical protein [Rhodohalobacter sp. 8-1]|uniref:hypothetical protein n=1 Tax=Rhodohalobacter sp. 8-1 TaxID=3131972 RepID=UPI0030EC7BC9